MSGITDGDQFNQFSGVMAEVDELCEKEANVKRRILELENINKYSNGGLYKE